MGVQAPAELRALEGWIGPPLDDRAAFFVTARKSGNRLVTGAGNTNTPLGGGGTERDSRWDRRAPGLTVPDAADDLSALIEQAGALLAPEQTAWVQNNIALQGGRTYGAMGGNVIHYETMPVRPEPRRAGESGA